MAKNSQHSGRRSRSKLSQARSTAGDVWRIHKEPGFGEANPTPDRWRCLKTTCEGPADAACIWLSGDITGMGERSTLIPQEHARNRIQLIRLQQTKGQWKGKAIAFAIEYAKHFARCVVTWKSVADAIFDADFSYDTVRADPLGLEDAVAVTTCSSLAERWPRLEQSDCWRPFRTGLCSHYHILRYLWFCDCPDYGAVRWPDSTSVRVSEMTHSREGCVSRRLHLFSPPTDVDRSQNSFDEGHFG